MEIRRLFAIFSLVLVGGILVACGTDDDDAEPTATIAPTEEVSVEPTATEAEAAEDGDDATPVSSPAATPVSDLATPEATPLAELATPDATVVAVTEESEEASPEADAAIAPVAVSDDAEEADEPEPTPVPMTTIDGTLTLDGRVQQDFTLSEEGCVGLGEWRQLKPDAQVIVRDAAGTVVDIAMLEGQDSADECVWSFVIDVPGTDFFSVSIPMVTEVWFDQNDPAVQSGELELFVP